ncbi:MAG: GGDEF domain-containing protein [Thermoanaerobaculales bacterium]|nr:GGDEF domain-containing protein [Thermoanaerobaculales bacterium]
MKGAGTITLGAGGLPVLAAWLVGLSGLPVAHRPITDVLAEVLAVLLLVLGWRFRRGRLVVAAVALALANFLVRGPLADAPSEAGLAALAILLPVTLAVLSLLPERPISSPLILILLGVVIVQSWLVAEIGGAQPSTGDSGLIATISELLTSPDLARLAFLIAGAFIALAYAARHSTFEGSLLWVTAASALALLAWKGPHAATLALTAAQLVLLIGLVEDSYRLAYHDELTGLPGRRALEEALRALNGNYAIAMVDVDHFKKFNDRHGHAAGDQALRMVAAELQNVGGGGRAYRYGGEEFTILFPGTTPAEASEFLETIRTGIADRRFAIRSPDRPRKKPDSPQKPTRPPRLINVTVSIGFAGPSARTTDSNAVLRAADRALYRAKNKGRNRVVRYGARDA